VNFGTSKGQAAGMSLMSLGKLDTIQDNSGSKGGKKRTLLNFIARVIAEKDKELLPNCKNAIVSARKGALVSLTALETDITECVDNVAVLAVPILIIILRVIKKKM
jgi:hypothetical protein